MIDVIAFGAGDYYFTMKECICKNYNVIGFWDNDNNKIGQMHDGMMINKAEDSSHTDACILITTQIKTDIIKQLFAAGFTANRIYCPERWLKVVSCGERGVRFEARGVVVDIETRTEEGILYEVFGGEIYNINLHEDLILIDVGLNIGLSTLFFARNESITHIYSYEPDTKLYNKAVKNIELNPQCKNKISLYNLALSDTDKVSRYYESDVESAGLRIPRDYDKTMDRMVEVECVNVSNEIKRILSENENNHIMMKCDCEGAEYEILSSIINEGLLKYIDAIAMEWHVDRRNELEDMFRANGFGYFINDCWGKTYGTCYAFNLRK